MKEKLGLFLMHRPTQQDLKVGGILPTEEVANGAASTTDGAASNEAAMSTGALRRRLWGRQDSKNSIFTPGSPVQTRATGDAAAPTGGGPQAATSTLTNKSIRDKINWDYLSKRLPDDYPVVKPTYVSDPDVRIHIFAQQMC